MDYIVPAYALVSGLAFGVYGWAGFFYLSSDEEFKEYLRILLILTANLIVALLATRF